MIRKIRKYSDVLVLLALSVSLIILPVGLAANAATDAHELIETFTIREAFGVSHRDQIIDFDLSRTVDPERMYVIGPEGQEVPYQLLTNGQKLAVRTDLSARASKTWKLLSGRAPSPYPQGIRIQQTERYYEINNQLTGVRIPMATTNLQPTPAPIQGLQYRDGRWTATGPNDLCLPAQSMAVRFLVQGPLKMVVEVAYQFPPPPPTRAIKEPPTADRFYRCTIEMQAGQPTILLEEEGDHAIAYHFNVYPGLQPNQAMYCGHHASSVEAGRGADGQRFSGQGNLHLYGYVDLNYTERRSFPKIDSWNPWIVDSGWFWQLYDTQGSASANLLGLFAGKTSRSLNVRNTGVNISTTPSNDGKKSTTIHMTLIPTQGGGKGPQTRYHWGIFMGVKGQDLKGPREIQPIQRQMNVHAGVNLNKLHRLPLDFPDPPQGYGALYTKREYIQSLMRSLRDKHDGPYGTNAFRYLYDTVTGSRDLWSMWADATGAATHKAAMSIAALAHDMLDTFVNRDGIHNFNYHYWMGGLPMMRKGVLSDCVLADPLATPEDRAQVKAALAFFAAVLWDDDFTPLHEGSGIHLGTDNMPVQQTAYRSFYALMLARHPMMQGRVEAIERTARKMIQTSINEHGAHMGCVHYISAAMEPTLNTLMQLKQLGINVFADEPRLAKFAEFYMNFQTPPELRFGSHRLNISTGDGPTESSPMLGIMATGFRETHPDLSARLMWSWKQGGSAHSDFFANTVLEIDNTLPAKDPKLGNGTFPGYYSVLRHGWDTPTETALWIINGEHYRDHYHNDRGAVIMYALGLPLSLDWDSQYAPRVAGGALHSTVLPESAFGGAWDQDIAALDVGGRWTNAEQDTFVSLSSSAYVKSRFRGWNTTWTRSVCSIHPNEAFPILVIRDTFSGDQASDSKISTLQLLAEGDVETPVGRVSPPVRTWGDGYNDKIRHEYPSAGQVFTLPVGLNRLGFTGTRFGTSAKPLPGIDWDLYTFSEETQQAHIGNWAVNWVGGAAGAFRQINGREYEERQHLLRIKGKGSFTAFLLPYRKGQKRDDLQVTAEGLNLGISSRKESTIIGPHFFTYKNAERSILALFAQEAYEFDAMRAEGGPLEILRQNDAVKITVHGKPGLRKLTLPGKWQPVDPATSLKFVDQHWELNYREGQPITIVMKRNKG